MPGRRLIILMVVLLISLSVLSASRDVSRTRLPGATSTQKTTTPKPKPAPTRDSRTQARERPPRTVDVQMPGAASTKVALGTRVIIRIRSSRPEIVSIEPLGVRSPVGPGTAGRLDFIASSPGRFPVTLAISGEPIGEIEVRG